MTTKEEEDFRADVEAILFGGPLSKDFGSRLEWLQSIHRRVKANTEGDIEGLVRRGDFLAKIENDAHRVTRDALARTLTILREANESHGQDGRGWNVDGLQERIDAVLADPANKQAYEERAELEEVYEAAVIATLYAHTGAPGQPRLSNAIAAVRARRTT